MTFQDFLICIIFLDTLAIVWVCSHVIKLSEVNFFRLFHIKILLQEIRDVIIPQPPIDTALKEDLLKVANEISEELNKK